MPPENAGNFDIFNMLSDSGKKAKKKQREELLENIRTQNPIYIDTIRFFKHAGINLKFEM